MKWLFLLLMVTITNMAAAQPGQPSPNGPPRPDFRPAPDYRPGPDRGRFGRLTCQEWRRDARNHPCVRVPGYCRYR